jgi:hypothetical protein
VRKRISILLVLSLSAIMAYGVIGSGAAFTWNGYASQPVGVGLLSLTIGSTTPGATVDGNTVKCPYVKVEMSGAWHGATCNITVTQSGTLTPTNLSVFVKAIDVANIAHLDRFAVDGPTGLLGSPAVINLSETDQPVGVATSFPVSIDLPLSWGEYVAAGNLDNADMGGEFVVAYTLISAE